MDTETYPRPTEFKSPLEEIWMSTLAMEKDGDVYSGLKITLFENIYM